MSERLKKYEAKRASKRVSFNTENQDDQKRLDFVNTINFSLWVKSKIDEEITVQGYIIQAE